MREKLNRFMAGRYGNDQFNRFLSMTALVLLVLSFFIFRGILYLLGLVVLLYSIYRTLSRDIYRRSAENERFLNRTESIRRAFRVSKSRHEQRHVYSFFKCPSCRQDVRVPKGKGRICITCPKCRHEFIKTT
ncbi:MAG: hypothetical protein Q4B73_07930 [Lachnospiraceae bacterium]|nr:hypothetical protein [Lachnospiraceae bacterium]